MDPERKDPLKLDEQLCFALYSCSKGIIRLYKPYLQPYGLTYTQYITLLALWETDRLSVSELGGRLLLDSGTLTPLLKKLEKARLIERVRSTDDERSVKICLTPQGRSLRERFCTLPQKMFCHIGLSAEEADCLKSLLDRMSERIDAKSRDLVKSQKKIDRDCLKSYNEDDLHS